MKDIEDSALAPDYKNSEAIFYVRNTSGGPCGYILPFFAGEGEGADCYDPHSIGCLGASMKMVEMFYTEHGVPISEDKQWVVAKYSMGRESDEKYTNVLNLNTEIPIVRFGTGCKKVVRNKNMLLKKYVLIKGNCMVRKLLVLIIIPHKI